MNIEGTYTTQIQQPQPHVQIGPSGDNEAAEKIPDNEAAEMNRQAPLADYQGQNVDLMA